VTRQASLDLLPVWIAFFIGFDVGSEVLLAPFLVLAAFAHRSLPFRSTQFQRLPLTVVA